MYFYIYMNLFHERHKTTTGATNISWLFGLPRILLTAFLVLTATDLIAQDAVVTRIQTDSGLVYKWTALHRDKEIGAGLVTDPNHYLLTGKEINRRVKLVAVGNIAGYAAVMYGLNKEWYSGYPRSSFHFFNDNREWLQVDKVGHMYSAYIESYGSMELWRWTGIGRKKRILLGGLSGAFYQTVIETLDGFSSQWGWSWGDFSANVVGSSILTSQELLWDEQRIRLKFSFHRNDYGDPALNKRADELYGKTLSERFLKDYNAQTYWASANLQSFLPHSDLPSWLSIAVGYGAEGMFGAEENVGKDKLGNITFSRTDIPRYRQWYLAPDVDFRKIKTKKKGLKILFAVLDAFKFPAPSLEFSQGRFKLHAISF